MVPGPASKPLVTPFRGRALWGNTAGLGRNILQGNEPRREKIGLRDFRPDATQIGLYSHNDRLEAWNRGYE